MPTETTNLLYRAVVARHSSEARAFWEAALAALTAGTADPQVACRVLSSAAKGPMTAESVTEWLLGLIRACGDAIDPARVLAHADAVGNALSAVRIERPASPQTVRLKARLREAMPTTTAVLDPAMV